MVPPRTPTWKYDLYLLFTVLVWGLNFVVLKAALAVMHLHVMNAFRLSVSAVVLGLLYMHHQRRQGTAFFAPLRTHLKALFGLGFLGYVAYQLAFIMGIDRTTAGSAALIMASVPLWTALVGYFFKLEDLTRLAWLGLLVVLGGAITIVVGGTKAIDFGSTVFAGNVFMLAAAILWGSYTAFSKPVLRHLSPITVTFMGLLFGLPFLLVLAIPYWQEVAWDQVTLWIWLAIIFSGGLSTGIATALWNTAVKHVGPSQTAVYGNLTPLIALFSSALFLNETIAYLQLFGGGLIISGLLVMRRGRRRTGSI